jgi:tetraacyldisaccharide 4'-kinase
MRWWWYRGRAHRLPRPVVSVGNLHWGGTGKTPVVEAVAAHLRDRGLYVAILSRGYRRTTRGPLLVSRGRGPELDPWEAGDEPFLLASCLPGVAVAVGERRQLAGELALAELDPPPDLFLLDDGFSHLALARDVDLLVLPAGDPVGGANLPPRGRLREPLAAAARAHGALLWGDAAGPALAARVSEVLGRHGFSGEVFTAALSARLRGPEGAGSTAGSGAEGQLAPPCDRPLLLITGIARPERAEATARATGAALAGHMVFADHFSYPPRSLRAIEERCRDLDAGGVMTTTKDAVKLQGRLELPLWVLEVSPSAEAAFWGWLDARLAGQPG